MFDHCNIAESMVRLRAKIALSVLLLCGCVGSKPVVEAPALSFEVEESAHHIERLWTKRVGGVITDLSVSRNGQNIVIATSPNPDVPGGGEHHTMAKFTRDGHMVWRKPLKVPVRAQSISGDGSLIVASTYDDRITGYNAAGKPVWAVNGLCKPILLERIRKIVCYHDDDAESSIAFDVFGWNGQKILSYPIPDLDILALKISEDDRNLAIALTGGHVLLFDPDYKIVWDKKVSGEISDVSVSSGKTPEVAVLYTSGTREKISVLDAGGTVVTLGEPHAHVEQIEISPTASDVFTFGNGPQGQYLALYPLLPGAPPSVLKTKWERLEPRRSDYSSSIIVSQDRIIVGIEDLVDTDRHTHLLGFDFDGNQKWSIPVIVEEGVYLYEQDFASENPLLAITTDDGVLSVFKPE